MKLKYISLSIVCLALAGCVMVPKTKIEINPVTHQVSLSNPKDTIIMKFQATIATNGTSTVSWDSLSTVMNPTNISETANGEASIVTATGNAIQNAVNSAAAIAAKSVK